jgi:hypothetical protein
MEEKKTVYTRIDALRVGTVLMAGNVGSWTETDIWIERRFDILSCNL